MKVRFCNAIRNGVLAALALLAAAALAGTAELHSFVPLGSEGFRIGPQHQLVVVLATAELPSLEGIKVIGDPGKRQLIDAQGQRLRAYPRQMQFRVTASGRVKLFTDDRPYDLDAPAEMEPLLRSLTFRLKIFHGLQQRTLEPVSARMIGVPADVPYDERIYQVQFDVGTVPIDDAIVLEVLLPDGSRLCKFHLDFN